MDGSEEEEMPIGVYISAIGRAYAAEERPDILEDPAAVTLMDCVPDDVEGRARRKRLMMLAYAARSAAMDRHIRDFLRCRRCGVVVLLGCGLETASGRCPEKRVLWYIIDRPGIIEAREKLLPSSDGERLIPCDPLSEEWIEIIRGEMPDRPLLIVAEGELLRHSRGEVLALLRMLRNHGDVEVAFDTVGTVPAMVLAHSLKRLGCNSCIRFRIGSAKKLAEDIGPDAMVLSDEPLFRRVERRTAAMRIVDMLKSARIVRIKLNDGR